MTNRKSMATADSPSPRPIISRLHQHAAGMVTAICLLTLGADGVVDFLRHGRMIDIDHATEHAPAVVQTQIDINEAEWPELTLLPGISETLARRIVEFRRQHGRFHSLEQLQRVHGIGPRSVERMRPHLAPLPTAPTKSGSVVLSD